MDLMLVPSFHGDDVGFSLVPLVATSDVAPSVNKRRYVVCTLSGFGMGIFLLLCLGFLVPPLSWDSELFTTLEATDAWCLGGLPVRSSNQGFVDEFNMPTAAAGKINEALKASSSTRVSAPSQKLDVITCLRRCSVRWTLRLPATRNTGSFLQ